MEQVEDVLDLPAEHDWNPSGTPPAHATSAVGPGSSATRDGENRRIHAASEDDGAKYRLTIDDTGNVSVSYRNDLRDDRLGLLHVISC